MKTVFEQTIFTLILQSTIHTRHGVQKDASRRPKQLFTRTIGHLNNHCLCFKTRFNQQQSQDAISISRNTLFYSPTTGQGMVLDVKKYTTHLFVKQYLIQAEQYRSSQSFIPYSFCIKIIQLRHILHYFFHARQPSHCIIFSLCLSKITLRF